MSKNNSLCAERPGRSKIIRVIQKSAQLIADKTTWIYSYCNSACNFGNAGHIWLLTPLWRALSKILEKAQIGEVCTSTVQVHFLSSWGFTLSYPRNAEPKGKELDWCSQRKKHFVPDYRSCNTTASPPAEVGCESWRSPSACCTVLEICWVKTQCSPRVFIMVCRQCVSSCPFRSGGRTEPSFHWGMRSLRRRWFPALACRVCPFSVFEKKMLSVKSGCSWTACGKSLSLISLQLFTVVHWGSYRVVFRSRHHFNHNIFAADLCTV